MGGCCGEAADWKAIYYDLCRRPSALAMRGGLRCWKGISLSEGAPVPLSRYIGVTSLFGCYRSYPLDGDAHTMETSSKYYFSSIYVQLKDARNFNLE